MFRGTIDELAEEYNRRLKQVQETYSKLDELEVVAQSADGMVTVKVGPGGQVRGVKLDPRVYRKLSPSELSAAIMEQFGRATAQVAARTEKLVSPLMPEGLSYEAAFGPGSGLEAFMPKPVEPES
jgi:DNA-binding protein YbaB